MAGIYIHIPFCKSRCIYCDFYSTTLLSKRDEYVESLCKEFSLRKAIFHSWLDDRNDILKSIYIGGGTPSVLSEDGVTHILNHIRTGFRECNQFERNLEITIEVNPSDINVNKVKAYIAGGINRISIGVQSFQDDKLKLIGRRHDAETASKAVKTVREAGIENISIDLMYGLPNESMDEWKEDIEKAIDLGVEHISAYCLTYEDGTKLYQLRENGEVQELEELLLNDMQDYVSERLGAAGYRQYEVSNYAIRGFESVHNSGYWNKSPYLGLGAGAHSYNGKEERSWNIADINKYMCSIQDAFSASSAQYLPIEYEHLTPEEQYNEVVMLGLRTSSGVAVSQIDMAIRPYFLKQADKWLKNGLVREDIIGAADNTREIRYVANKKGRHILNRIIEDLMI